MSARLLSQRLHDPLAFAGRVEMCAVESEALAGNALGDPSVRELPVYVPPEGASERYPVLFVLAGFTSRGQSMLETHPWRLGPVARYDRAVARGEAAPAVLVLPDAFTRLGGSQYVNSPAVGAYADYVARELTELVDRHFPTLPGRRGVLGKSSGGFGALHLAMRQFEGVFHAVASISGDCAFENVFGSEILAALRGLLPYDGDPARFLTQFLQDPDLSGDGHAVINVLAMAACYSPNPESPLGFDLPFDLETGERRHDVWKRWLAFDPLHAVEHHVEALRRLEALHIECGLADEFHLQWGARRLSRRLTELEIEHVHEEHPGGHRGIDRRYAPLLTRFAERLR